MWSQGAFPKGLSSVFGERWGCGRGSPVSLLVPTHHQLFVPIVCLFSKVILLWEIFALLIILEDCSRHIFRRDVASFVCTVHPGKRVSLLKGKLVFLPSLSSFPSYLWKKYKVIACSEGIVRLGHSVSTDMSQYSGVIWMEGFTWLLGLHTSVSRRRSDFRGTVESLTIIWPAFVQFEREL